VRPQGGPPQPLPLSSPAPGTSAALNRGGPLPPAFTAPPLPLGLPATPTAPRAACPPTALRAICRPHCPGLGLGLLGLRGSSAWGRGGGRGGVLVLFLGSGANLRAPCARGPWRHLRRRLPGGPCALGTHPCTCKQCTQRMAQGMVEKARGTGHMALGHRGQRRAQGKGYRAKGPRDPGRGDPGAVPGTGPLRPGWGPPTGAQGAVPCARRGELLRCHLHLLQHDGTASGRWRWIECAAPGTCFAPQPTEGTGAPRMRPLGTVPEGHADGNVVHA